MRRLALAVTVAAVSALSLPALAFVAAWKAGHFQELDRQGSLPLLVEEEDYYTPDWALDEEEWLDEDA